MSAATRSDGVARGRILGAWEPPVGAGDPVGLVASTFTFDASFFEEELLGRFLALETSVQDGRAWLVEREQKLGVAGAVVLADRRHLSRSSTLAWDLLAVPTSPSTCQHSKITVLAWEQHVRVIVGSANLSEAAYRRNLEVFAVLDFHREGAIPSAVLGEILAYLRRMVEQVPDPVDVEPVIVRSPRKRALALLDAISGVAAALGLPADWPRGATRIVPVLLEPGRGPDVLAQAMTLWGDRPRATEVWLQSPFWPDPQSGGCEKLVAALAATMSTRGKRELHLLAPGFEDAGDGGWHIEIPIAVAIAARADSGCRVVFRPVVVRQEDENRPLHAKLIWWGRDNGQELLLMGSSNASLVGLGITSGPRNYEANLCFVPGSDKSTSKWFDRCFPEAPELETAQCSDSALERRDDEGGAPPLPAYFRWACFGSTEAGGELRVAFAATGAPERWSLALLDGRVLLDERSHQAAKSPQVWRCALKLDPNRDVPPSILDVRWTSVGEQHLSHLPVNALDDDSRSRADLWADLDLETLLELLASGGQVHRQLARMLRPDPGRIDPGPDKLDPHKRVDTSRLLMQRVRRISRALEGMCERLSASIHSEAALEWRFRGPLSPRYLAQRLVESTSEPSERRFLVAEVALAVGRAARAVQSEGISKQLVAARYRSEIETLQALAAESTADSDVSLDRYVQRAFERALS